MADTEENAEREALLRSLIVPYLDPADRLFAGLSAGDSDISVLSDPFSDVDCEIILPQEVDLKGTDVFEAFNFSPLLRETIAEVKPKECQLTKFINENPDQMSGKVAFTNVSKKVPLMVQMKIANLLNDKSIYFGEQNKEPEEQPVFVPDEKKTWEDIKDEVFGSRKMMRKIKKLTEKEKTRQFLRTQSVVEIHENMEGYWRMLSDYQEFVIAPPDYDAYFPSKHWMETEPIPWEVQEESRKKVKEWLDKYL